MIPVIHNNGHNRTEWVKRGTLNAFCLQYLIIFWRQCIDAADIVINQPDIHTLFAFLLKYLHDAVKHHSLIYDKIFQKNKMFCLFQICKHIREHLFSTAVIFCGRIMIKRKSCPVIDISGLTINRKILSR